MLLHGLKLHNQLEVFWVSSEDCSVASCNGLPSVKACAVFFLALCTSRHMVPLDTPIFSPASSCERPSRSTSLRASISAGSISMGRGFVCGEGENLAIEGAFAMVIGFGKRTLLPRLHLCREPIVIGVSMCCVTFIYFCALSHN